NLSHWNEKDRIINYDVISYYGYLPAYFIYDDVTLQNPNHKFSEYEHNFWLLDVDGKKFFKTSMGMSIVYSPFFLVADVYARNTLGVEPNGYSYPYTFALAMSSLFYFWLGLWFLRKILRRFFDAKTTGFTLLFVGLGTNVYYYVILAVGMSHMYLFCFVSMFIYLMMHWFDKVTFWKTLVLGLLLGLMTLMRPIMIVLVLLPIFYGVSNWSNFREQLSFFVKHWWHVLIVGLSVFIVWIPQFIYWKMTTESYLLFSYSNERFFFSDPKIWKVLFSFRSGWLLYTPIMIFALWGLVRLKDQLKSFRLGGVLVIFIYLYLISSWWCWWFGGGFGCRSMIELYPLMVIGLAAFIQWLRIQKKRSMRLGFSVLFFLTAFSLFQTRQAHEGLIHSDGMTGDIYGRILFKLDPMITYNEIVEFADVPDYEAAKLGEENAR
ncbi:MAG: hypothetical protein MK066_10930, partial [Crocinitomicaceae bacterium]|nr:hypothetical protein [Crocinitomicaceae bacterium]